MYILPRFLNLVYLGNAKWKNTSVENFVYILRICMKHLAARLNQGMQVGRELNLFFSIYERNLSSSNLSQYFCCPFSQTIFFGKLFTFLHFIFIVLHKKQLVLNTIPIYKYRWKNNFYFQC